MVKIPVAVERQLKSAVSRCRTILKRKIDADPHEADTTTIITYILEKVFGFNKIEDIRKEVRIESYKCDMAVMLKRKVAYLIEVKSIGTILRERHIKQAVTYASVEGIRYVVLTNGVKWQVYRVTAEGKVRKELLFEIDFLELNTRRPEEIKQLFMLCKRGVQKDAITDFYEHSQVFNRYTIGNLLLTKPVLQVVHREMRKLKDGTKTVPLDQIQELMEQEVIKLEILGDEGEEARKLVNRSTRKRKKAAT